MAALKQRLRIVFPTHPPYAYHSSCDLLDLMLSNDVLVLVRKITGEGGTDLSVAPTFAGGGSATRSPSYTPLSASGVAAYHRCPRVPFHCQTAERKTLRYRRENLALALFSRRYLMRE